jgi:adenosylmethionine-8-amino-7-oxononanoate aminotransferase
VQRVIRDEQLLPRVVERGAQLDDLLRQRLGQHPNVGDIRGRGLFRAIELVADRATKRPLPPEQKTHARVKAAALANGLLCYPSGGTIDGQQGDHVLLAPPFNITPAQLEELVDKLVRSVETVLSAVRIAA